MICYRTLICKRCASVASSEQQQVPKQWAQQTQQQQQRGKGSARKRQSKILTPKVASGNGGLLDSVTQELSEQKIHPEGTDRGLSHGIRD